MKFYSLVSQDGDLIISSESWKTVDSYAETYLHETCGINPMLQSYDALTETYFGELEGNNMSVSVVTSYMDMPNVG